MSSAMEAGMASGIPIPDKPAVADAWFWIKDGATVGPMPLAELVRVLKGRPDRGKDRPRLARGLHRLA
jgi:hypothetical protein